MDHNIAVLQSIAEDQWSKDLKELNLDRDNLPIERALGLLWCVEAVSNQHVVDNQLSV